MKEERARRNEERKGREHKGPPRVLQAGTYNLADLDGEMLEQAFVLMGVGQGYQTGTLTQDECTLLSPRYSAPLSSHVLGLIHAAGRRADECGGRDDTSRARRD